MVGSAKVPQNATNGTIGCITKHVTCMKIVLLQLAREILLAQNIVRQVGFKLLVFICDRTKHKTNRNKL